MCNKLGFLYILIYNFSKKLVLFKLYKNDDFFQIFKVVNKHYK